MAVDTATSVATDGAATADALCCSCSSGGAIPLLLLAVKLVISSSCFLFCPCSVDSLVVSARPLLLCFKQCSVVTAVTTRFMFWD